MFFAHPPTAGAARFAVSIAAAAVPARRAPPAASRPA